jgi:recombination protein RecT
MATAAETTANPVAVIRQNLQAMEPEFKAALPPHIPVEKFKRVALTAIQNTPALVNADRRSLFGAFVRLAQDGLLPDGREAAVVMFGNKAQAMPMIAGVLKKIRQSGEVAKVSAQVVYANDKFVVKYGFEEDVEHVPPALNEPRGEPIGAYATAVLKDGSQLLEVMSLEEIERVRKVSRAANNGPWVSWFGEMARKTVMRRLSKRLPMSTDLEDEIFSRDETMQSRGPMIEGETVTQQEAPVRPLSRLDAIEHQIVGGEQEEPPVEPPEITEQAEEIEAEIVETDEADASPSDPRPAQAKCDEIIAEIEAAVAIIDINSIVSRHKTDIIVMPPALGASIEIAADKRKRAIEDARAKKPADGELAV